MDGLFGEWAEFAGEATAEHATQVIGTGQWRPADPVRLNDLGDRVAAPARGVLTRILRESARRRDSGPAFSCAGCSELAPRSTAVPGRGPRDTYG